MNKLFDLIERYWQKFAFRALQMSGASQQALDNYLSAVRDKQEERIQTDKELSGKLPWLKLLFYGGLFALGLYAYNTISRNQRKWRRRR